MRQKVYKAFKIIGILLLSAAAFELFRWLAWGLYYIVK